METSERSIRDIIRESEDPPPSTSKRKKSRTPEEMEARRLKKEMKAQKEERRAARKISKMMDEALVPISEDGVDETACEQQVSEDEPVVNIQAKEEEENHVVDLSEIAEEKQTLERVTLNVTEGALPKLEEDDDSESVVSFMNVNDKRKKRTIAWAKNLASMIEEHGESPPGSFWFACSRKKTSNEKYNTLLGVIDAGEEGARYFKVKFHVNEVPDMEIVLRPFNADVSVEEFKKVQVMSGYIPL